MTTSEAKRYAKSSDPAVRETAKRVLAYAQRQKAMRKSRRSRAPGPTKAERRDARNARMAIIREQVMARAAGVCEWCGAEHMALEAHHVIGGGARRSEEAVETVAAICFDCHRLVHRNERAALTLARIWAERGSYSVALAAIRRRLEKVEEARTCPF